MEDDGDGEDLTPFWIQSNANLRRGDRLRRGVSSFFLSSGLVVFLLLVTAFVFLAFVVPSTLSFSAQIFRPSSVKKSWDSLNVVLVLVAVVFGFLSRNKNEDRDRQGYLDEFHDVGVKEIEPPKSNNADNYRTVGGQKSDVLNSREWYEYSDVQARFERKNSFLRRNSSSYPDLREVSAVDWNYGVYQRRFYDDFHVDPVRDSDQGRVHRRHRSMEEVETLRAVPPPATHTKTVIVDTLVSKSKEAATFPPAMPPPPPQPSTSTLIDVSPATTAESPPVVKENPKGKTRKEGSRRKLSKNVERINPITQTAPPPPPPPPPLQQKSSKSDRKRGGATGSATKDFLNSLYHKKKKKQRQKSVDNFDHLLHEAEAPLSFQLHPPQSPPPPPSSPPPPSVLQNLFSSKKQKRKRIIKVTLSPPEANPNPQIAPPSSTRNPPNPINLHKFEKLEETSNSGGDSPLNRIPPPPPPPPAAFLKNPAWKFIVQGDYIRVNSTASSRSGSPDPEELDSDITPSATDGGDITPFHPSPLFCASPDVNSKAESFITNFRAKLKLEKVHSMKRREPGLSSLGPKQI